MFYTHKNTKCAKVYDVDSMQEIDRVMEVNSKAGWIKVSIDPIRIDPSGKRIIGERIRFRSIYAISGDEGAPCLFHCYGRAEA